MSRDSVDPALVEDAYPFQARIGFRLVGWDEGYARFELPLEPHHMNRYGIPHGGLYGVLLDTAMGYSGSYSGEAARRQLAMTLSMTTNFLSRPEGHLLIAEGHRTGGGRSTFFAEAAIRDETGIEVATATGVFRIRAGG